MKTIFGLIIYFNFLLINTLISQEKSNFSIDGIIVNEENSPIDFSVISIFSLTDSLLYDQKLTDDKGHFNFSNLKPKEYFIKLKMFTSESIILPRIQVANQDLHLGEIKVERELIQLKEVETKSSKPVLIRAADHVSLEIKDSYLSRTAYQTFEILNLIPNVYATADRITIKNTSSILYLINGKGNRTTNEINRRRIFNLQNSEIDRIDVYSNPPARFDADGFSVIDVITTKNTKISTVYSTNRIGVFQNNLMRNSYSTYDGIDLNYKLGNIGFYSNLQYQNSQDAQLSLINFVYHSQNTKVENVTSSINNSPSASINMGANYKLNQKNEFNLECKYATNSIFDSSRIKSYNNLSFINNGIIDSVFQTSTINNSVFTFNNLNIGYWYNNKSFNADIQFHFDGMSKSERGLADLLSSIAFLNKQLVNNYSGLVNFRDTLFKKLELRYGLKRNFALSNEEINNIENIGIFRYTEEINALYSQLSGKSLSILWNIGLRFETTSWKINKPTNDNGFYLNLFPSLFLNKKFKNMTVNLSYTKRIQRQTISEANPLLRINNQLFTLVSGNIRLLKPQIFDSYEFNLDFKSFNLSTYFNRNINPRVFFPIEIDSLRIIYTPQSAKYENTFGLNLKLPLKYKMINTNLSLYSNLIISQLLNQKSVKGYSNSFVFNINYQLNNFAFSGSVNYSLPYKANYISISSYWIANFSIAYQSKANPWSIRLNLTDLFGRKVKWNINYPLVSEDLSNLSYSRAIQLGLRYNLKLGKEFNKKSYEGFLR